MTLADRLRKVAEFGRRDWPAASCGEAYKTRGALEENARLKPALLAVAECAEALEHPSAEEIFKRLGVTNS